MPDKSYVTTRVLVPEQDLSSGTLKLALLPGVIGELRFADPNLWGTRKSAFPAPRRLAELRDLEQGLEQMKRVPSPGCGHADRADEGALTATLSAYSNNYFQQIAGVNQTFISSGKSETADLKLHRVLNRSQNDVFGMQFRLTRRFGKSFIEDTEVAQQRRPTCRYRSSWASCRCGMSPLSTASSSTTGSTTLMRSPSAAATRCVASMERTCWPASAASIGAMSYMRPWAAAGRRCMQDSIMEGASGRLPLRWPAPNWPGR
ncbi:outer membrane hemolysin activator protein [Cupriavidus sp. GA3-3]|nr:outer membrane hemolysin activator protein [Cupriavidus sp. GA3-3]